MESSLRAAPDPRARDQPAGTVSLLFSDIEGSTRLLQTLGSERYAEALAQHRLLLRQAFAAHRGYEVDCEGDQFFIAFQSAREAIAAAAEAQRALADHAWPGGSELRVRVGIHTGEPLLAPPKYVGLDVHRAARLMAAAHGGQVLVSQATRDLCARELPPGLALRDLGEHRLKDLTALDRVHQLVVAGLRQDFPPPRTLTGTLVDLPAEPNRFVGRARELEEVCAELGRGEVRLLTLTGPGGSGKTRLALRAAARSAGSYRDGVRFVALAPLSDLDELAPRIEQALGLSEQAGVAPEEVLRGYLAGRELLLVLDNLEHLLAGAGLLADLLSGCPGLQLLVTSREPLNLSAEHEYTVPPLDEAEAVELFHERARAVKRDFTANGQVADICRRLDALPLAVELAAAHARSLTAAEILARLEARLPLLTGGPRDAPERQQTLRAAIDWSHDLLRPAEQCLFAQLAVFAGGCSLEAAEAVCHADLETLQQLVGKSLLRDDAGRYVMLETIREYALERLQQSGDADAARRRHADHFVAFRARIDTELQSVDYRAWRAAADRDLDNMRAAVTWSIDANEAELALRLATATGGASLVPPGEQERLLRAALALRADSPGLVRARALVRAGQVASFDDDLRPSQELFRESLDLFRQIDDAAGTALALAGLGEATRLAGDLPSAKRLLGEADHLFEEIGETEWRTYFLRGLAKIASDEGDVPRGRALLEKSLELEPEALWCRQALGDLELTARRLAEAESVYLETLGLARTSVARRVACYCLAGLAATTALCGEAERAGRLWGAVETLDRALDPGLRTAERTAYETHLAAVRRNPSFEAAVTEGRALEFADALEYALSPA